MEIITPYVISLSDQKPKTLTLVPSDPSSRYKTKQLQVQTVGKSKMIRSVFVNILEVAKSMQVPPSYIVTFMGYEIGAQAKFDEKKPERQQASLSGEHATKDLSRICRQFIQEVLLCPVCGLPELLISVEAGKNVIGNCRACGGQSPLPITNEKFKRYIINHPPSTSKGAFGGNKTGEKKETVSRKDNSKKREKSDAEDADNKSTAEGSETNGSVSGNGELSNGNAISSGSSSSNHTSNNTGGGGNAIVRKQKGKTPSEKDTNHDHHHHHDDDDGVVWFSDTSEAAAKQRREQMLPSSNVLRQVIDTGSAVNNNSRKEEISMQDIKAVLRRNGNSTSNSNGDVDRMLVEELKKLQVSKKTSDETLVALLIESLLEPDSDPIAAVKSNKNILAKLLNSENIAYTILDTIEKVCAAHSHKLAKKTSLIVKEFYDNDLIEEDMIIKWFNRKSANQVPAIRAEIAPLISWFNEAEEESSESENDNTESK